MFTVQEHLQCWKGNDKKENSPCVMIGCTGGVIRALLIRKWWWLDDALAGAKKTSWWEKCHHLSHRATIKKHFALFISFIFSISHTTVEILLSCKMFKTFSPRCTLNGYPLELNYPLFLVKVSKKHKLYSAKGFVSSQSNALYAIIKSKISGSTRWEENQTCLNLLPPLCTK